MMEAQLKAIRAMNQRVMYRHTMAIWRQENEKQPNGSTKLIQVQIAEAIPCKLSKKDPDKATDIKEDVNPIQEAFVVFCDPEVEVLAGDYLEIGGTWYLAGNPFVYPAHQEIHVARRRVA